MKLFAISILLFSTLACSQNVSNTLINENLDNFPIRESLEDKGKFQGQVYSVKNFISSFPSMKARFVRVTAKVLDQLPKGHSGEGKPAWIFSDEFIVE